MARSPHVGDLVRISALNTNRLAGFVDDTNVYRVTIHKTFEANLTTKPIGKYFVSQILLGDPNTFVSDGAIFIFNPRSGQSFWRSFTLASGRVRSILDSSRNGRPPKELLPWSVRCQSRNSLSRSLWLARACWVRPNLIILCAIILIEYVDPLEVHLFDFPNIVIKVVNFNFRSKPAWRWKNSVT